MCLNDELVIIWNILWIRNFSYYWFYNMQKTRRKEIIHDYIVRLHDVSNGDSGNHMVN